jgi:hypothetical protein
MRTCSRRCDFKRCNAELGLRRRGVCIYLLVNRSFRCCAEVVGINMSNITRMSKLKSNQTVYEVSEVSWRLMK